MKNTTIENITESLRTPLARLAAPVVALLLCLNAAPMLADDNGHSRNAPDLPAPACDSLSIPAGNKLSFHAYALGVQIYHWDGVKWVFIAPAADLFADPCYEGKVGTHYAGPTWEHQDGSKVVGSKLADCTPFRGAIPWLKLAGTPALPDGHGVFGRVTYIQRLNTIGGTAPATAGLFVGDEARVPYTAEYFFYRASRN